MAVVMGDGDLTLLHRPEVEERRLELIRALILVDHSFSSDVADG